MATEINKLRVERLVWILVYGGLLALVLGMFVQRYDRLLADILQIGGTIVAGTGALLIWVRSRMK
ncbi:hypothetical protein [Curvibacter sp. PAE-UM]|jgi:hypothetical protein|uniref:hypothetical protein n=1 Tax=Curvibacter sp. PAE-UM TaxID=1714344 RepID=UPI00070BABD3|nr:hypothetical protein [Curvibacter sp. PAE-UM]KRI00621.1 hypothetical protein AO057_12175 [Curvibacter sp. PAE-UM]